SYGFKLIIFTIGMLGLVEKLTDIARIAAIMVVVTRTFKTLLLMITKCKIAELACTKIELDQYD
ncbi:MAG: hypothetical protein QF503_00235, partial [Rhodospirillales bacterium]|nr:hypothetical protein [Rhodospirillales bacterium]